MPASPRSKLRLVRARLVLSEYLTFSLQGFRQLGEPLMPPWIEIISACTPLIASKSRPPESLISAAWQPIVVSIPKLKLTGQVIYHFPEGLSASCVFFALVVYYKTDSTS